MCSSGINAFGWVVPTANLDNFSFCLQCTLFLAHSPPIIRLFSHSLGANLHQSLVLGSRECSEAENSPRRLSRVEDKMRADGMHLSATVPLAHARAAEHVVVCCLNWACAQAPSGEKELESGVLGFVFRPLLPSRCWVYKWHVWD